MYSAAQHMGAAGVASASVMRVMHAVGRPGSVVVFQSVKE